ncbi:hypothetical protein [Sorangium sp. So ce341]|uniref:hypothetical protein n=1 Tax=Sorangium sp. So ce341 TaxID=3133302 RepID=UPI003F5DC051
MNEVALAPGFLRELQLGDALTQTGQLFSVILTLHHWNAPLRAAHGPHRIEA